MPYTKIGVAQGFMAVMCQGTFSIHLHFVCLFSWWPQGLEPGTEECNHFLLRFRLQINIPFCIVGETLGRPICKGQQIPDDFESFPGAYLGALRPEPGWDYQIKKNDPDSFHNCCWTDFVTVQVPFKNMVGRHLKIMTWAERHLECRWRKTHPMQIDG